MQYLHFHHPWRSYHAKSQGWLRDKSPRKIKSLLLCYFAALLTLSNATWAASACVTTHYDEASRIKYIVDGDTLHLSDGRKVRLIGINAPEVAHGNNPAEPFATDASKALKTLFKNSKSVSLVYGEEKHDHYGRLLAHIFTADGSNVQAALLAQGYARSITFPPNSRFTACYQQQERKARCDKKGLWKKIKPLAAKKLDDTRIGFQLITGKLKSININKKGIWLNMGDKLTVGIRPDNQSLFNIHSLYKMLNQKIVVRGWLNKSKKSFAKIAPYYIRARHPSSIQLAARFACNSTTMD